MDNFRAGAYAITAGIALVIVLYISYIAIPIILLCSIMAGVYLFKSRPTQTTTFKPGVVRW